MVTVIQMYRESIRFLFMVFTSTLLCSNMTIAARDYPRTIRKVLHNQTDHEQSDRLVELGSIVLYFDREPTITVLSAPTDKDEEHVFLLPLTGVPSGCQELVGKLNEERDGLYRVSAECVVKPISGLKLTFNYAQDRVGLVYDTYEPISGSKAVVFRFYNRDATSRLRMLSDRVLRTADSSRQKKKSLLTVGTVELT